MGASIIGKAEIRGNKGILGALYQI